MWFVAKIWWHRSIGAPYPHIPNIMEDSVSLVDCVRFTIWFIIHFDIPTRTSISISYSFLVFPVPGQYYYPVKDEMTLFNLAVANGELSKLMVQIFYGRGHSPFCEEIFTMSQMLNKRIDKRSNKLARERWFCNISKIDPRNGVRVRSKALLLEIPAAKKLLLPHWLTEMYVLRLYWPFRLY